MANCRVVLLTLLLVGASCISFTLHMAQGESECFFDTLGKIKEISRASEPFRSSHNCFDFAVCRSCSIR